ncbi:MAG: molybdopterin synthase [Acidobacteria bacterium]|nr:MAG: molybdopterin synthase [Acidobacteriota bacterium]
MRIRVLFFGMLKDLAGYSSDSIDLPEHARVADVLRHYEERIPRMRELVTSMAMSVNQEYAGVDVQLKPGDEVALLPPVSGGADSADETSPVQPARGRRYAAIVRERIDTQGLLDKSKQPEDGAAVAFEGVVRNNSRGRRTLYLDYEAYEAMALKQMEQLALQALSNFRIRDVSIVHRLGRLEIGETSVAIVVASAHRAAAFEACHWIIDTLKRTVPIWKKEYFEDGAVWADGEAFPDEVAGAQGTYSGKTAS